MKKGILKICLIVLAVIVLAFGVSIGVFFATTVSSDGCVEYCKENTARGATKFSPIADGRYVWDYIYWIAADGDSEAGQEVFVFKRVSFVGMDLGRYKFVCKSDLANQHSIYENKVGTMEFFTRSDDGEKENCATRIYFAASQDAKINSYEYTLTVREGSNVYQGYIGRAENPVWLIKFCGLESNDYNTQKEISDVKFYDKDGKVYTENQ